MCLHLLGPRLQAAMPRLGNAHVVLQLLQLASRRTHAGRGGGQVVKGALVGMLRNVLGIPTVGTSHPGGARDTELNAGRTCRRRAGGVTLKMFFRLGGGGTPFCTAAQEHIGHTHAPVSDVNIT